MYFLYFLFRVILFPWLNYFFPFFVPKLQARINFEKTPVLGDDDHIEYSFEVSSEGELEQVRIPLVELIKMGKNIELLYCSPSVKRKCHELYHQFPNHLTIKPVQIIRYLPFGKKEKKALPQGRVFVLCRYDFFPEFIFYGRNKAKQFVLLSGAVSTFDKKNVLIKKYLLHCYRSFDHIVCATKHDFNLFLNLDIGQLKESMSVFDFRILSIQERLSKAKEKINSKFPLLIKVLNFTECKKKVLFGSFWPIEKNIIVHSQILLHESISFLAPHNLDLVEMKEVKHYFEQRNKKVIIFDENSREEDLDINIFNENPIVILNIKGILCELYSFFDYAYVGGGFGKSIHSVLEPFLAGCHVFYGPNNLRSSEKILINELSSHRCHEIKSMDSIDSAFFKINDDATNMETVLAADFSLEYNQLLSNLNWK